jgi:hypothetical protein
MIHKIKAILLSLSAMPMLMLAAAPATVFANHNPIHSGLCTGSNLQVQNGECVPVTESGFQGALTKIINLISIIIGVIAVIMIIFGGFRYITSGGSPDKVTGAKNTILYAIIGLIIVALAQVIVRFVLNTTAQSVQ